jgi:hypothetical protein
MSDNVKVAAKPSETGSAAAADLKPFGQRLNHGRTDTVAAVGTVEVVGLPQVLHTRNFGGLDVLFIPLLDTARGILSFMAKMCTAGESKEQVTSMARIRLASEMLQDPSFTLAPRGMDEDNSYLVDREKARSAPARGFMPSCSTAPPCSRCASKETLPRDPTPSKTPPRARRSCRSMKRR